MKALLHSLLVAALLLMIWGAVMISNLFTLRDDTKLFEHVPEDAEVVAVLDTRALLNEVVGQISGEKPDKDLELMLDELVRGRIKKFKFNERIGIHVLGKIIFFHSTCKEQGINGFICLVNDEGAFKRYFNQRNYVAYVENGIGVVTMSDETISKKVQHAYTKSLLRKKGTFLTKIDPTTFDSKIISAFWNMKQQNWKTGIEGISISLGFKEQFMMLEGIAHVADTKMLNKACPSMQKKGLQVSSSLIPNLPDGIRSYLTSYLGYNLPKIKGFCLNYRGINIQLGPPVQLVPDADILLEFEHAFSIEKWLTHSVLSSIINYRYERGKLIINNQNYYCKQLKTNRIYIGRDKNPIILPDDDMHLLRVKGALGNLLQIQGSPLITTFMDLLPGVSSLRKLADSTKELDLHLVRLQNGQAKLSVSLEFPMGKKAFSEGVKLLLSSDLIKQ